jgi:hypothetical protein
VTGIRAGFWWLVAVLWLAAQARGISAQEALGRLNQAAAERAELDESFRQRLVELQTLCRRLNLPAQAEATARWFPVRDPRRQYLFVPGPVDPLKPAEDAPTIVHQWSARLTRERQQRAEELFQLALRQLERDAPTSAYQLLHEVLHEAPDHPVARHALGYRQAAGQWVRPNARIRVRHLRTANPALGIASGPHWVIDSEHFSVATTHSEAAGRQLAEQLEVLHTVWRQLFFPFWSNATALTRRLDTRVNLPGGAARHNVVLFRDRDEYGNALRPVEPMIETTTGLYLDKKRVAFFYFDGQPNPNVFYHEVTHQLFSETGRVAPDIGRDSDYWIVEGIALYMESLRPWNGNWTVGGIDSRWMQFARYRALRERFYVPLEELIALGRRQLQEHPEIRRLYSQSAGLTAMLMDDRRGKHRDALVQYLQAVYAGRTRIDTLPSLTGEPLESLDARYRQFLDVTDQDLEFLAHIPVAEELSLGGTSITDAGLRHLAAHTRMTWLDLGATAIGDEGFAHVRAATALKELVLQQTRITDQSLPILGTFRHLETLDLSGTAVTDQGLKHLGGLSNLRELWIDSTAVSDAGLEHLHILKNLKTLEANGTRVTPEGRKRLRAALPSLEESSSAPEEG